MTEQNLKPCMLPEMIELLAKEHGGLRSMSRKLGVDVGYLSRLASAKKYEPTAEMLFKLGLRKIVLYERATEWNTRAAQPEVVEGLPELKEYPTQATYPDAKEFASACGEVLGHNLAIKTVMPHINAMAAQNEALRARVAELEAAYDDANSICRSAYGVVEQIAIQHGDVVAGHSVGRLHEALRKALLVQHAVMFPKQQVQP